MDFVENRPSLTEPGVKYFLGETLKKCHEKRSKSNYYFVNFGFLGLFIFSITIYLIYKYKTRPTEEDREKRKKQKNDYFISKVRQMQSKKAKSLNQAITDLPKFESPVEALHNRFYNV